MTEQEALGKSLLSKHKANPHLTAHQIHDSLLANLPTVNHPIQLPLQLYFDGSGAST